MAWLFGNAKTFQAVIEDDPTFERIQELQRAGFELVVDHGTKDGLRRYASEHTEFSVEQCAFCGHFTEVDICDGARYRDSHERWIPFRKTSLCAQCQDDDLGEIKITRRYR